jgi:hypothetical protein
MSNHEQEIGFVARIRRKKRRSLGNTGSSQLKTGDKAEQCKLTAKEMSHAL